MKISVITGGRSDCNALGAVFSALSGELVPNNYATRQSLHDLTWVDLVASPAGAAVGPAGRTVGAAIDVIAAAGCSDLAIVHGDRHEILGAAVALNVMGIPIAHIGGGDITEGSQDDCFRHAITKLSHLHFATHQDAADRIIQMGEQPDRVYVTGDPGLDALYRTPVMGSAETFRAVGFAEQPSHCVLVVMHPNTLGDVRAEFQPLFDALLMLPPAVGVVLIGPNADAGGEQISRAWDTLTKGREAMIHHRASVAPETFYSLMSWCRVMVGNSSAAYHEAPVYALPAIDIGDRQRGRPNPGNVTRVPPNAQEIIGALMHSLGFTAGGGKPVKCNTSLFGDGYACERIRKIIREIKNSKALLRKSFHNAPALTTRTLLEPAPLESESWGDAAARVLL